MGLSAKFDKSDLLISFKKQVRTLLKDNRLDWIADRHEELDVLHHLQPLRCTLGSARMAKQLCVTSAM
jgi:hypothetical protein